MAKLKRCDLCGAEADNLMSIEFPLEERWMLFFRKKSLCHYADVCLDCLEKIRAERQAQIKANEVDFEVADTSQTEKIKTLDYCDICNHKGCDNCIANNLDDYCVPSGYAPKDTPQTDCAWMYDSRRDYEYDKALDEMEKNE